MTRRLALAFVLVAGLGAACGLASSGAVAADSPGGASTTPACPASNPPDTLALVGGTPQTAKLGAPFAEPLQVALVNSNGCPVTTRAAGSAVTFAAPASGPSGTFASSGSSAAVVGASAAGAATAPGFTANRRPGAYTVVAISEYGTIEFSLTNTARGVPAAISAVAPSSQSAAVGGRYARPLQANVLDADGNPVEGASVTFSLGSGGGAADAAGATFDGGGTQATVSTDESGTATSPLFAANDVPGRLVATAATAGIAQPATFALHNLPGRSPTVTVRGPTRLTATVGSRYARPLRAVVKDAGGRPVEGATVTFSLGAGGAGATAGATFVGGSAQATGTTDASGRATSPLFTANDVAGAFAATASLAGAVRPATFALVNLAAKAPELAARAPIRRSATVGSRYARPLQVRLTDAAGKPVQGATVSFSLGSAGGGSAAESAAAASFVGGAAEATAVTDRAGVATSPPFSANTVAGRFTATASSGAAAPVAFSLRNLAAKPATVTAGVGAAQSAPVRAAFAVPLAVKVTDAEGNAAPGVEVTFAAPARGASGRFGAPGRRRITVETDASGIAVAPRFAANGKPGGYVVTATAAGVARPAAFALVNGRR